MLAVSDRPGRAVTPSVATTTCANASTSSAAPSSHTQTPSRYLAATAADPVFAEAGLSFDLANRDVVIVEDVVDSVEAVEKHEVVKAAMFVAAGYFTLTFYDLFALRTIERPDIPYRVAALAGFTSYAVGHNVGASAFTGGAVRYRIYSRYGLSAIDVAKVCFIAALIGGRSLLGSPIVSKTWHGPPDAFED